jgi:hypothetical protein
VGREDGIRLDPSALLVFRLIPAAGVRRAIGFRAMVAMVVVGGLILGWTMGWVSGWAVSFMAGLLLGLACILALRWDRERGMWMMYALMAFFAVAGWVYYTFGALGPGSQASKVDIKKMLEDAALAAWLCTLQARLMVSAAVHNFRRFRGGGAGMGGTGA